MHVGRPRANSLHIPIPVGNREQWRTPRPPTPGRSTYPQVGAASRATVGVSAFEAPIVPLVSYWEPDTPDTDTSPLSPTSPCNPFLYPPLSPGPRTLFPMASPVLPASPLSIFDQMGSPVTPTFLFPRTPPCPLSPRSLAPRTPPLPLPVHKEMLMARRHSTMRSVKSSELEKARYEKLHAILEAIRGRVTADRAVKKQDAETVETNRSRGLLVHMKSGTKMKDRMKMLKRKGLAVAKETMTHA